MIYCHPVDAAEIAANKNTTIVIYQVGTKYAHDGHTDAVRIMPDGNVYVDPVAIARFIANDKIDADTNLKFAADMLTNTRDDLEFLSTTDAYSNVENDVMIEALAEACQIQQDPVIYDLWGNYGVTNAHTLLYPVGTKAQCEAQAVQSNSDTSNGGARFSCEPDASAGGGK